MQRIVLLSSLLWWELGTNSLITGPGEWLSFRRFTSNYPDPDPDETGGGGVAQRLDNRMKSQTPRISSCRVVRGTSPGEILKTKKETKAISGHFAMPLKSQIYLSMPICRCFREKSSPPPFIPCFLMSLRSGALARMRVPPGKQTVAGSILTLGTFFRGVLVMKEILRPFSPFRWFKKGSCQLLAKECALSTGKLPRTLAQEVWIG